ncbi:MAG: hypothetical protein WHX60_17640, partial [Armatimonadota bacterium]
VTLRRIEPGEYKMSWCHGTDWDSRLLQFAEPSGCFTADRSLVFEEQTFLRGGVVTKEYTVLRVTLHKVPFGNLTTEEITPEQFALQ